MAVRDRNLFAWQAYVITMAFVSVGLILGMFFLWRSYSDLDKKYDDQETQLSTARSEFTTSEGRVDRLLSMMGIGENTEDELNDMANKFAADERLADVEKEFAVQMKLFAPNVAASEKNLLKLPKYLLETIRIRNEDINAAREREAKLLAEMTATLQRETKAREDAVSAQKKAEADLEGTRQKHAAAIAKLNAEKEDALRKFDSYKATLDQQLAVVGAENRKLKDDNQKQAETIATQMDIINGYRNPDFAAPQGEVISIKTDAGSTTLWINLGRADGLREGVPFSVIDESAINISEATPKAKLVIKRVIPDSPHLSQAMVTEYSPSKPIMTGDKVYSPAWRPGRTVGFALAGMMDINDDGKDDLEQVRELIRLAGGQIDAEIDTKGNRVANLPGMSPNTSFLVMGTDLNLKATATPEQRAKAESYAKFIAEARQMGIIHISLDKLMGYLKVEGTDRTVPLGNRIRGDDFPIRRGITPPASTGSVSEIFQGRSP